MGYTTEFTGRFDFDRRLASEHSKYLFRFSETRRQTWKDHAIQKVDDPIRVAAGLPPGPQGCYFTGAVGDFGQEETRHGRVLDSNNPPHGQPSLWCDWQPTDDCRGFEWNGGEKFYNYVEWLKYIIAHFIEKWGYKLNGRVNWKGEDESDTGVIIVKDNEVSTGPGD